MSLQSTLVEQFHHPKGLLGRLAGAVMAHRASNRARNRWTVELLDVQPGQSVLELGPGPGVTLDLLLERVRPGRVTAVDHSELMLARCRRRHRDAVRDGVLELICAEFPGVPDGGAFDRILAVNSLQFDGMNDRTLRALADALKPGGRIAITFQPRAPGAGASAAENFGRNATGLLANAGFTEVRTERLPLMPVPAVCVIGERR